MAEIPGILFRSGEPFAIGACRYLDAHPGREEPLARIYVRLQLEGLPTEFLALLDTGGHYCLLNEEMANLVREHLTAPLGEVTLRTAFGPIRGELFLHRLRAIAEEGDSLDIEVTVFIPTGWQGPSILGYTGGLDRIRFAVDPEANCLYVGPLGWSVL